MHVDRRQKEYWDNYSIMTTALNKGRAEGRAEGIEQGRAEGIEQGRAEGIMASARKMKAKGYALADIADITGLSAEEIEKL